jgi:sulfonate transport system permease protein
VTSPTELAAPLARTPTANNRWSQRKWGLIRLASPPVLLGVWQLGSALGLIPQDVLPTPSLIVEAGVELIEDGQLADALSVSGRRVVERLAAVLSDGSERYRTEVSRVAVGGAECRWWLAGCGHS